MNYGGLNLACICDAVSRSIRRLFCTDYQFSSTSLGLCAGSAGVRPSTGQRPLCLRAHRFLAARGPWRRHVPRFTMRLLRSASALLLTSKCFFAPCSQVLVITRPALCYGLDDLRKATVCVQCRGIAPKLTNVKALAATKR